MANSPRRPAVRPAALIACALAAACARPPVPAPAPTPVEAARELTASDRAAYAELLRIEDGRFYDSALMAAAAITPSAAVRARAALALARLARPESAPLLRPLLADPDSAVAATAAFALGEIGDSLSIPALAAALVSPGRPTVSAEAADALGKIPSGAAQRALLDFLATADPAGASSDAIGSALLGVWRLARPADPAPIARWGTAPDAELRWRAAYALVRRLDARSTRLLVGLAADADPRVRSLAARGLVPAQLDTAAVPRADAVALLFRLARDPDYATRINAVRSLGAFSTAGVPDTLRSLLRSPDDHLALAAMESLGRLGSASGAAGELEAIVTTPAAPVFLRQTALETLALVAPERARAAGARLADDPLWRMRAASAVAIARGGGIDSPELRALVEDPDARVAATSLQGAIDAVGDSVSRVRSLLLERLASSDPFVRMTALTGLARLKDPALLPLLLDAYQRAQRDTVNDAALAALDAIGALKSDALDPSRAFLARFPRSSNYLVRQRAEAVLGPAARAAWGAALPLETGRPAEVYREVVDRWADGRLPEALISTSRGDIRVRLFGDVAPLTTENFLALAARGYFDGQEWPRVVPNFVVQGGDPRGDTNGGPGYVIRDEINRRRYLTGTLGMALSGPDTGGSQFFLTHSPQPHLDGIYTVFGEVVEGLDVLERILPGDQIRSIRAAN